MDRILTHIRDPSFGKKEKAEASFQIVMFNANRNSFEKIHYKTVLVTNVGSTSVFSLAACSYQLTLLFHLFETCTYKLFYKHS